MNLSFTFRYDKLWVLVSCHGSLEETFSTTKVPCVSRWWDHWLRLYFYEFIQSNPNMYNIDGEGSLIVGAFRKIFLLKSWKQLYPWFHFTSRNVFYFTMPHWIGSWRSDALIVKTIDQANNCRTWTMEVEVFGWCSSPLIQDSGEWMCSLDAQSVLSSRRCYRCYRCDRGPP